MPVRDRCGKCGSGRLLSVPATPGQHSHIVFGARVLHTVRLTTYVCSDCGIVEHWVDRQEDRLKLEAEPGRGGE